MMSFFTAGSWEKDTIFGAAQTNSWPFLFCQSFSCFFPVYKFSMEMETRKTRREKIVEQILEKSITVQNTAHVNATYHNGRF